MDIAVLLHELAETIGRSGQARAVFGEPIKLDTQTIVPVGVVMAHLGGGGGKTAVIGAAGGAGMRLDVLPVGFIHEREGVPTFTALELPFEQLARVAHAPSSRAPRDERADLLAQLRRRFVQRP